jgi:epoxyqueuosine reductase
MDEYRAESRIRRMVMIATLTSRIREAARQLGFFKMGICAAKPLPDRDRLDWWLQQGMQGEMRYMERQAAKRKDPRLVMSRARSILSLATNYYSGNLLPHDVLNGRISSYAWGEDYHHLVKCRLDELLQSIRRLEHSAEGLCYVDTGPIMEKVWGAHSSLGWKGTGVLVFYRRHSAQPGVGVRSERR